jgi:aromatic ring-opening dioxygenase LigB subunit
MVKSLCSDVGLMYLRPLLHVVIVTSAINTRVSVLVFRRYSFDEVRSVVAGLQHKVHLVASEDVRHPGSPHLDDGLDGFNKKNSLTWTY